MEMTPRRGRPPKAETELAEVTGEAGAPSKRRRRASVGGHAMKLDAPSRAGYERRWVNDANNRIAEIKELAYDFVNEQGIKTDDPSSVVSRTVGTKANGEPLKAYLMETPNELYAEGAAEKEAHNAKVDEAIRAGRHIDGHREESPYNQGSVKFADR